MTTDQATTVQPATYDDLIERECTLVAFHLREGNQNPADKARERLEWWVLRKHGKVGRQ